MSSNPPSCVLTPNANKPRFTSQSKTAEELLSNQTVGLVALSDFRKRRAEAIEQKERDAQDALYSGANSGRTTPVSDDASTPKERAVKKQKRKVGPSKLSFGEEDEDGGESTDAPTPKGSNGNSKLNSVSPSRGGTPMETQQKKKIGINSSVVAPKALTKSALLREAQIRESLRKEFLQMQDAVKATEICIPFVFYDGTNIPGGVCRVKKGDYAWVFLDRSRKVGADLGVGEKANCRREWARIGVDDLMMVRGSVIIPHHYDFYYFIINHTLEPNNRILFEFSAEPSTTTNTSTSSTPTASTPTASTPTASTPTAKLENYDPLSRPPPRLASITGLSDINDLEGANDDPTFTKVVDRRWYERNKHIFPASVWQEFDPEKDYQKEVKRDAGGNAFFFS